MPHLGAGIPTLCQSSTTDSSTDPIRCRISQQMIAEIHKH